MLKCIYGLMQVPCQYYMLCHEVYQKACMKQPGSFRLIMMSVSEALRIASPTSSGNHRSQIKICLSQQISQHENCTYAVARVQIVLSSSGSYHSRDVC